MNNTGKGGADKCKIKNENVILLIQILTNDNTHSHTHTHKRRVLPIPIHTYALYGNSPRPSALHTVEGNQFEVSSISRGHCSPSVGELTMHSELFLTYLVPDNSSHPITISFSFTIESFSNISADRLVHTT